MNYSETISNITFEMIKKIEEIVELHGCIDLESKDIYITMENFTCIAEKVHEIAMFPNGSVYVETESNNAKPLRSMSIKDIALIADVLNK